MERLPCVYILTSKTHGILYTGVTSNLLKRIWEHKKISLRVLHLNTMFTRLFGMSFMKQWNLLYNVKKQLKTGNETGR